MTSIAIIGAGPSGLAAAKAALECGLTPTVFEKSNQVGGLWKPNGGSVWEGMRTNLSYHSCAFSDMAWTNPSGNFPTQKEVCDYLTQYAELKGIMPHIHLQTEAEKVSRNGDKWLVRYLKEGMHSAKEFDFVIVASGIFSKAVIPQIDGIESCTAEWMHSQQYKNPSYFKDKVVAVIGNSYSGTEIAADISTKARRTIHIASKAMWVLPRELPAASGTCPVDLVFYSRAAAAGSRTTAQAVKNARTFEAFKKLTKQHEVAPELEVLSPEDPCYVVISDGYIDQVRAKKIELVRSRVQSIAGNRVVCEGGRSTPVDAIVFATGYECSLPFLEGSTLKSLEYMPEDHLQPLLLHKCVFHPDLPNMAFVGMYRGPYFATMELQARLAVHVFAKLASAPEPDAMAAGIAAERQIRNQQPRPQFPHGNYVDYADGLAEAAGVLPNLDAIKQSDPALHAKLYQGPLIAAHYRLEGHASNRQVALELIDAVNN